MAKKGLYTRKDDTEDVLHIGKTGSGPIDLCGSRAAAASKAQAEPNVTQAILPSFLAKAANSGYGTGLLKRKPCA